MGCGEKNLYKRECVCVCEEKARQEYDLSFCAVVSQYTRESNE